MSRSDAEFLQEKEMMVEGSFEHIRLGTVTSTNDYLHERRRELTSRITLATAEFQTKGRGATGGWESEEGKNVVFSVLLHPTMLHPRHSFVLSECIALAICDALNSFAPGFQIKWPNDIYHHDRKIVGILIENELTGRSVSDCIMGVGVNVNQRVFLSDAPNPGSMAQVMGHDIDRQEVLNRIMERLFYYYNKVENGDFAPLHTGLLSLLYHKDELHPYRDAHGDFRGTIIDVEPTGHLVIRDEQDTLRRYAFKEVQFC